MEPSEVTFSAPSDKAVFVTGKKAVFVTGKSGLNLFTPPKNAGYYDLRGTRIYLTRRPRWLARKFCAWLLDWTWHDMPQETP